MTTITNKEWGELANNLVSRPGYKDMMLRLSKSVGCGGCANITTVETPFTCETCGRMLCGQCGNYCQYHDVIDITEAQP